MVLYHPWCAIKREVTKLKTIRDVQGHKRNLFWRWFYGSKRPRDIQVGRYFSFKHQKYTQIEFGQVLLPRGLRLNNWVRKIRYLKFGYFSIRLHMHTKNGFERPKDNKFYGYFFKIKPKVNERVPSSKRGGNLVLDIQLGSSS